MNETPESRQEKINQIALNNSNALKLLKELYDIQKNENKILVEKIIPNLQEQVQNLATAVDELTTLVLKGVTK